jgi:tRNA(Phe) wybutosine-synthesizing methylase Tyw3
LKKIAEEEGYKKEELISAKQVRVYIAEKSKENNSAAAENGMTLTPAIIDENTGIEARSFDETINNMNRIQDRIIWEGAENE